MGGLSAIKGCGIKSAIIIAACALVISPLVDARIRWIQRIECAQEKDGNCFGVGRPFLLLRPALTRLLSNAKAFVMG